MYNLVRKIVLLYNVQSNKDTKLRKSTPNDKLNYINITSWRYASCKKSIIDLTSNITEQFN